MKELRVVEIRKNILVREDGMVRNISGHNKAKKDWHCGNKSDKRHSYMAVHVGGRKSERVHRMVAEAFIPNPDRLPQVNHINHVQDDNRVDNLEWCSNRYSASNQKKHLSKSVGASLYNRRLHAPKPWMSKINIKGKSKHLGYFTTELEAHQAYMKAYRELEEYDKKEKTRPRT